MCINYYLYYTSKINSMHSFIVYTYMCCNISNIVVEDYQFICQVICIVVINNML